MVLFYRELSYAAFFSPAFGSLMLGDRQVLARNGKLLPHVLRATCVSEEDIREGLRNAAQLDDLDRVELVSFERNGQISPLLRKGSE